MVAVVLAGLTLGFFGWYALIVPHHHGAISELGLLTGLAAGPLARDGRVDRLRAIFCTPRRNNASAVAPIRRAYLASAPASLAYILLGAAIDAWRPALPRRHYPRVRRQGSHRGTFQSDRPRGPHRLRRHSRRDHRHRRACVGHHRSARRDPRPRIFVRSSGGLGTLGCGSLPGHCDPRIPGHRYGILPALSAADTNRRIALGQSPRRRAAHFQRLVFLWSALPL